MSDEERENEINDTSNHLNRSVDTPHDETPNSHHNKNKNKNKRWEELYKLVSSLILNI